MYQIKEMIRTLFAEPFTTQRTLAKRMRVSKGSIYRYRKIIRENKLEWKNLVDLSLSALDALFNKRKRDSGKVKPDYEVIQLETEEKPYVTVYQLWLEYRRRTGKAGYSYSRFAHLYARYLKKLPRNIEMRQTHKPGGELQVDFSGEKPTYIDQATGRLVQAELFVGVLTASNYAFACVLRGAEEVDVIDAHVRMYAYFGGAADVLVPDNMKTAVIETRRTELRLQEDYALMAAHYGVAPLPARPHEPRDKGVVEGMVKIVQMKILGALRHRTFESFEILEGAVLEQLELLNDLSFSKSKETRRERFRNGDARALLPLPEAPYTFVPKPAACVVPPSYHVRVRGHYYSVPHELVGDKVQVEVTPREVLVYFREKQVARHVRSAADDGTTTDRAHQAPNHQARADMTQEGYLEWAKQMDPAVVAIVEAQFDRVVPLNGLIHCERIKNLAAKHEEEPGKFVRACEDALATGLKRFDEVERLLHTPRRRDSKREQHALGVRRRALQQYEEAQVAAA